MIFEDFTYHSCISIILMHQLRNGIHYKTAISYIFLSSYFNELIL